jgi:lysozyme
MTDLALQLIEESEGCRLTAYKDTRGLWTIGVGHLLTQDRDWTGYAITQQEADAFLSADSTQARALAVEFPYFQSMNEVRQAVCISMCFQMGSKPLSWPHFIQALHLQDYTSAAAAGLDSLWAVQTPVRAQREMKMLESGAWVDA